jgi:hypothetical protein
VGDEKKAKNCLYRLQPDHLQLCVVMPNKPTSRGSNSKHAKSFTCAALIFAVGGVAGLVLSAWLSRPDPVVLSDFYLVAFADGELTSPTKTVLQPGKAYPVLQQQSVILDPKFVAAWTPIERPVTAYEVSLDDGRRVWCTDAVHAVPVSPNQGGGWRLTPRFSLDFRFLSLALVALAVLCWLAARLVAADPAHHWKVWALYPMARIALVLFFFGLNGFYTVENSSEYFDIAIDWLNLRRTPPSVVCVGTAFFYVPLIIVTGATTYSDINLGLCILNFALFGSANLLLVLMVVRSLTTSKTAFHVAGGIAAFFPFVVYFVRVGDPSATFIGKTAFCLGLHMPYSLNLFYWTHLSGWNGDSDNPAVCFMLLGIVIAIRSRIGVLRYLLLGLSVGFAMTIRYASIVVIPVVVWIDLTRLVRDGLPVRRIIAYYATFAVAGFVGFLPQLFDNWLIAGHPLRPSALPGLYKGGTGTRHLFNLDNVLLGTNFFFQIHFKVLSLLAVIIGCLKPLRAAAMLWLWCVVPIGFLCLLNFYAYSATRYLVIVFPALYVAIGLIAGQLKGRDFTVVAVVIAGCLVLTNFEDPYTWSPIQLSLQQMWAVLVLAIATLVAAAWRQWLDSRVAIVALAYLVVYATGQWWVGAIVMAATPLVLLWRYFSSSRSGAQEKEKKAG